MFESSGATSHEVLRVKYELMTRRYRNGLNQMRPDELHGVPREEKEIQREIPSVILRYASVSLCVMVCPAEAGFMRWVLIKSGALDDGRMVQHHLVIVK